MTNYNFTCHNCGTNQKTESLGNEVIAAKEINWGMVFNTTNGMTTVYFCSECFGRAKKLAQELQNIIKLECFHFNSLTK